MAIITISGRRVKRLAKQTCAARPAKALAPWAGPGYWLTESGEAAMAEQEAFQRQQSLDLRQAAYRALGITALANVQEIRRRYTVRVSPGGGDFIAFLDFERITPSDVPLHYVSVGVTRNPGLPFACLHLGHEATLPAEAFELAAQLRWTTEGVRELGPEGEAR